MTPTVSIPPGTVGEPVTLAQTDYVVQVHRVLKADNVVRPHTATVIVRRAGGAVDRGALIDEYVDSRFPKCDRQGRYVLFLEPSKVGPAPEPVYFPVVGADSAFELVNNRVLPSGRGNASQQLARQSVQEFVANLAKRGGK